MTDVKDLHEWIVEHFHEHPLFDDVSKEELVRLCYLLHIYESKIEHYLIKYIFCKGQRPYC